MKAVSAGRKATTLKGNAVGGVMDVGYSVWKNRDRLRDPKDRKSASADVAWDTGEAASKTAGYAAGAAAGAAGIAAAAESVAVVGAAVASGSAVVAAAPVVTGVVAAWATGKTFKAMRRHLR